MSDDLGETVQDVYDRVPEEAWHDLSHLIRVLRALELAAVPGPDDPLIGVRMRQSAA